MTVTKPPPGFLRLAAIALCIGGLVHIGTTFAMPLFAGRTAYHRLAATLPLNALAVYPPIAPDAQPLPFLAADARYAMCRYDTSEAPVSVEATLPDAGWMLAIYSPQGDNFYYAPGQAAQTLRLSLILVPPGDQPVATDAGPDPALRSAGPVVVPSREGLLVVRAPLRGIAYDADIEARLRTVRCTPQAAPRVP